MTCGGDNDKNKDTKDEDNDKKRKGWEKEPENTVKECVPSENQRRNGFCDLRKMLTYVAILFKGSH